MKHNKHNARIFKLFYMPFILFLIFHSSLSAQQYSWIDSAESRYSIVARLYDSGQLLKIAGLIAGKPLAEKQNPRTELLDGLIYWRLELIAYCQDNDSEVGRYGVIAIKKFNDAEKSGADVYLTAGHKALASQLLAVQGISSGARYGPRAAAELKKAQKANPQGYFSLLVDAINLNQAPSFAGGNPKKAVAMLEKMNRIFPDSIDVKIQLADAYRNTGRPEDARIILMPIVKNYPSNLLARKFAAKLPPE
jgi:hypothetical protein